MTTATQTQIRRDTAANLAAATPANGELGFDTTNKRIVAGDGTTLGGIPHASVFDVQKQAFVYPSVGGTGDAITLTNTFPVLAYAAPLKQVFKAGANNTTAVTVNVDGLGTKNVKKMNNGALAALVANDIVSGGVYEIWYDGTQFQIKGLAEGPYSAGGFVYLGTYTASSSSTIDITSKLSSTYDDYEIILDNIIPGTNGVSLLLRASTDNSTFDSGSNYQYAYSKINTAGSPTDAGQVAQTSIIIADPVAAGDGVSGKIRLYNVNATGKGRFIGIDVEFSDSGLTGMSSSRGGGRWTNTSNAMEAVRFLFSSGNLSSGTFKVYGIAKS